MTPETIADQIKKIALLFRYGTKEKVFIFIGASLFGLAVWIPKVSGLFNSPPKFNQPIALALYVLGGLCLAWVAYRFVFKLALPKPHDDREPPNAIKGLLAFTQEDGELFRKLGRDQELNSLNNYVKDPQIPLVVIMGESGAGKSSLLRAGLSHLIKDSDRAYIYWEALPHNTVAGLLRAVNSALNTDYSDPNALLNVPRKTVIVLDQFEQLLPDNPEHKPVFDLLHKACTAPPPHTITWCIAFRREYSATWSDFERGHDLRPPMLSLKLFNAAQAQNVFVTLAEAAGLSLEQDLVDGFIKAVSREQHVSPVEIGIGLQMLNELTQNNQKPQLSLQDYNFAGGSQGLLVSFLNNALMLRFPEPTEREALYKLLLECIDLNHNQRIAEGKSMAQLAASSPSLSAANLQYALDYFASAQMRILELIPGDPAHYRLPNETMIPALRQLGDKILSEVAEAELLLQTAYSAWQNSSNNRRYLLSGEELKKVRQFQQKLDLGDRATFLKQSQQQRQKMLGLVFVVIALASFIAYYGYQRYLDDKYRSALTNWGLPGDLMDYPGKLKTLTLENRNIRDLNWLAEFRKLTTLTLHLGSSNITDLSALQKLKQLTTLTLDLDYSSISDLSALQELKQLTTLTLDLRSSKITNLSTLHELQQLTTLTLDLDFSSISDLSALQELKQLNTLTLDLRSSKITDLSALHELQQLTTLTLHLGSSNITDHTALKKLQQLTTLTLDLGQSNITDLSALQELKQLTTLNLRLYNSKIADLSALHELQQLTTLTLDLDRSNITDLSALHELQQLTTLTLDLSSSNITDLSALHELQQLTTLTLRLYDSKIADLSALQELQQLTTLTLDLSRSNITDLSALHELQQLTTLTLSLGQSNITDLSTLQELQQLTTLTLDLDFSSISDLSALHELQQLTTLTLNLGQSNITDLSTLQELQQLTTLTLNLGQSNITDLSALHELQQLTTLTLNLGQSNITDLSALHELQQLTTLTLDLSNSNITDLSTLKLLKARQITLDIRNMKMNSIKGIPNLIGLTMGDRSSAGSRYF